MITKMETLGDLLQKKRRKMILVLSIVSLCTLPGNYCTSAEDIRETLLEKYDTKVPPKTDGGPTVVVLGMTVNHFSLDEISATFYVNCWLTMSWNDSRLSFNSSDLRTIRFGADEIWKPDVSLYNSAFVSDEEHLGNVVARVENGTGSVFWNPPANLAVHCNLNLIRWPYDSHVCELVLTSWSHSGDEVELKLIDADFDTNTKEYRIRAEMFTNNREWTLTHAKATKNTGHYASNPQTNFDDLTFTFKIQRSSPSYAVCIVLPICIISLVNIMVFLLPPTSGEKITLCCVNCLIICIFLLYIEAKLPSLGDHLPLVVLLYASNLVLVGISTLISVIVLNLSRTRRASSPPQCFRVFCNVNFAKILGLGHIVPFVSQTHSRFEDGVEMRSPGDSGGRSRHHDICDEKDDHGINLIEYSGPYMINADWILLAAMIDRLFFIVYSVVVGILLGLCLA